MPEILPVALAFALGLVLGAGVGARLLYGTLRARRAAMAQSAAFARFWPASLPTRSALDIMRGVIRVRLGGTEYELPVLARGPSRAWLASMNESWQGLIADLDAAKDDTPAILARIMAQTDTLLAMVKAYDQAGILPEQEWLNEFASDVEIFHAAIEVWRAANPLVDALIQTANETPSTTPEPSSTPVPPTAGTSPTSSTA